MQGGNDMEDDGEEQEEEDAMMDYEQMDLRICGDLSKFTLKTD